MLKLVVVILAKGADVTFSKRLRGRDPFRFSSASVIIVIDSTVFNGKNCLSTLENFVCLKWLYLGRYY
jgi:hypothetical protein